MDLRNELKNLFEEELGGVARWVLLRSFSEKHSKYWNETTHEAVGGPPYEYEDILCQVYSRSLIYESKREMLSIEKPISFDDNVYVFYFSYDVNVKNNDEIFDLDYYGIKKPIIVYKKDQVDKVNGKVTVIDRYKINRVENYRCDEGRIEYKKVFATKTVFR